MMFQRIMGKASFAKLQDRTGQIQIFLQRDTLGEAYEAFKKYDVGDILAATGTLFKTKTGELSVRVEELRMLTKSLRPLPDKWHGMADVDTRYRQRYVDLIVNEQSRNVFIMRNRMLKYLRDFLDSMDFLEVETPMLQTIPGGAAARPFKTHHNALDMDMYLRIAPELYPQAAGGGRSRARVRDQSQFPQRGRVDAAQPRVHHARAVRRLRRLQRPHRHGRARHAGPRRRGARHAQVQLPGPRVRSRQAVHARDGPRGGGREHAGLRPGARARRGLSTRAVHAAGIKFKPGRRRRQAADRAVREVRRAHFHRSHLRLCVSDRSESAVARQ